MSFTGSITSSTASGAAGGRKRDVVDFLRVTMQLKHVVVTTPSKISSTCLARGPSDTQYALYTKWERGRKAKGKLTPVLMSSEIASRPTHSSVNGSAGPPERTKKGTDGSSKQMEVALPSTYQIEFTVGMKMKAKGGIGRQNNGDGPNTTYEKKTLEIELWFLKYKSSGIEKARSQQLLISGTIDQKFSESRVCAGTAVVDLRDLLSDEVRTGETNTVRIDLSNSGDYVTASYVIDYGQPEEALTDGFSDSRSVSRISSSSSIAHMEGSRMGSVSNGSVSSSSVTSSLAGSAADYQYKKKKKNPLTAVAAAVKGITGSKHSGSAKKQPLLLVPSSGSVASGGGNRGTATDGNFLDEDDMLSSVSHPSSVGGTSVGASTSSGAYNTEADRREQLFQTPGLSVQSNGNVIASFPVDGANAGVSTEAVAGDPLAEDGAEGMFPFTPAPLQGSAMLGSDWANPVEASDSDGGPWVSVCQSLMEEIVNTYNHGLVPGKENSGNGEKFAFSKLSTIVEGEKGSETVSASRVVTCSGKYRNVHALYNHLLGCNADTEQPHGQRRSAILGGSCMYRLHVERGDLAYPQYSSFRPEPAFPYGAYAPASYRMKLKKERYLDTEEYAVVVSAGSHVVLHSLNVIPKAPVVGDSIRLEVVLHLTPGSVEIYVYPCVTSGRVKFLFGSTVKEQTEKLATLMHAVISDMVDKQVAPKRKSLRFSQRNSITRNMQLPSSKALSSSLDPNLWKRLNDFKTLPHEPLVLIILRRLQLLPPPTRVTPLQVQTIENVLGYHRRSHMVVHEVLELLLVYARTARLQQLVVCSPTLPMTIRRVADLHRGAQFGPNVDHFLRAIAEVGAAQKLARQKELAAARNPWYVISTNIGDTEVVETTLSDLARSRSVVMNDAQVNLLKAALCLHLHSAEVCLNVIGVLEYNQRRNPHMANLKRLDSVFLLAISRAASAHNSVSRKLIESINFTSALRQREVELSSFERWHAGVLNERPQYECAVKLLRACPSTLLTVATSAQFQQKNGDSGSQSADISLPRWPTGGEQLTLYVTASWICVGDHVMALGEITTMRRYRWWLMPCLQLSSSLMGANKGARRGSQPVLSSVGGGDVGRIDIVVWERDALEKFLLQLSGGRIAVEND